jgi:uncharacterized protein (UPF0297 family)
VVLLDNDNTIVLDSKSLNNEIVKEILKDVYNALEERGYDPIMQISGYLISNDLGYISNHLEARKKISKIDREQIIEVLLNNYLKEIK